ncbi:HypC/HybG/HupF family hydrogenase formation chaperone [Lentzea tibetensis]|uniref:HypC/HybG/HupF family hydrogenase formation chaperone n=1 Tax=Lentzea tibetensis TaxID=2591470 RepID=A0A563F2N5_9PSEU|nr:HypC/HybG/HupF family hydrogenase formation chaperone [Lentzea tibetensis]TWP54220.1 HypC/HybG/HupF family hydrogenase formation chaperone [Lentzea tibetensis]
MCLGLPAEIIGPHEGHPDLMVADIAGVRRAINTSLLDFPPESGDWVLVHMGFALSLMTPAEAEDARAMLNIMAAE